MYQPVIKPKFIFAGIFVLVLISIITKCFFVVEPSELAGVRRFGQVIVTEPLGPGLHFKLPFVDTADTLQISMDTFKVNNLTVYTVDNQPVTISVSMSYRIPKQAVLKLLYEVGQAGALVSMRISILSSVIEL
jgi:regulator of protease activity HflC (stomatin/prohibitin superfamily)